MQSALAPMSKGVASDSNFFVGVIVGSRFPQFKAGPINLHNDMTIFPRVVGVPMKFGSACASNKNLTMLPSESFGFAAALFSSVSPKALQLLTSARMLIKMGSTSADDAP